MRTVLIVVAAATIACAGDEARETAERRAAGLTQVEDNRTVPDLQRRAQQEGRQSALTRVCTKLEQLHNTMMELTELAEQSRAQESDDQRRATLITLITAQSQANDTAIAALDAGVRCR